MQRAKLSLVQSMPVFGKWINFWYDFPAEYSPIVGLRWFNNFTIKKSIWKINSKSESVTLLTL